METHNILKLYTYNNFRAGNVEMKNAYFTFCELIFVWSSLQQNKGYVPRGVHTVHTFIVHRFNVLAKNSPDVK